MKTRKLYEIRRYHPVYASSTSLSSRLRGYHTARKLAARVGGFITPWAVNAAEYDADGRKICAKGGAK